LTDITQLRVQHATLPIITSGTHAMGAMNIRLRKSEVSIWKKAYKNMNNAFNAIAVVMKIALGAASIRLRDYFEISFSVLKESKRY
jgi:hypothetical protein